VSSVGKLKGKPIKIGLVAAGTGAFSYPWVQQAAQVGANSVNAAGGINGSPVQLDYCDDQSNPQTAAVCAQKLMVTDHDLMMVGDDGIYDAGVLPVIKSANSLLFGTEASSVSDFESPNVFNFEPELADYDVLPQLLPSGTTKVADFISDTAIAIKAAQANVPLYKAKGVTAKLITVPVSTSDFSTPCLQGKQMGATVAIVTFAGQAEFAPMAQACKQLGFTPEWVLTGAVISSSVLKAAASLQLKTLVVLPFTSKAYSTMIADAAKYGPKLSEPYTDSASNAYIGMKLLPSLIKGAGSLNAGDIKSWLSKQSAFDMQGFASPMNFTPANHPFGASFPALKNACVYPYSLKGSKLVQTSAKPICFKPPTQ
jgi:branched-chain amino acid transport system substrate-binding protein